MEKLIDAYLLEVHKKYSLPAACVVFVLVGAPLGILARRGGMAVSVGISIVLFILYWAFLIGGEELSDRGFVSPVLAMWSANILLGLVGLVLLFKVMSEKELTKLSSYTGRTWEL
jgi:lipopolysaccharide export system permease protein